MRQKIELVITVLLLAGLIFASRKVSRYAASDNVKDVAGNKVVVDAGHGGSDPGKIGINGLEEKEVNLAIAQYVEELLKKEKIEVVMTREKDEMLSEDSGEKTKIGDMKMRVEQINKEKPLLTVSIHQNSYPQEEIKGAQVFYYTHSEEGKKAAEIMQESLLVLDDTNHRKAKANDTYYLLKRTESPTIIVECGFLTNTEEAGLLKQEEYQKKSQKRLWQELRLIWKNKKKRVILRVKKARKTNEDNN